MKVMILFFCLLGLARADILSLVETNLEPDLSASPCQLNDDADVTKLDSNIKHVIVRGLTAQDKFVLDTTQLLSRLGYRVCAVPSAAGTTSTTATGVPADSVTILANGRQVIYYGKRDASSLLSFVQQTELRITSLPYEVITNKMDKKAYEHVNVPKVVGYFADPNSPEFQTFVEAAGQLAPMTPFYVVHDQLLATKLRITQPNQVILVRRLEKSTIYFQPAATPSWTAADLVAWVNSNRGLVMHVLDDTNLYDPEIHNTNYYQLVSIGNRNSPLGLYFYKVLTKSIQNISRENDLKQSPQLEVVGDLSTTTLNEPTVAPTLIPLDDIKVVWIDLGKYPSARSKVEALVGNQMIGANNKDVWFGLMSMPASVMSTTTTTTTNQVPVWFDMSLLNTTTGDRGAYDDNILLLRNWILEVTNRVPAVDAQPINSTPSQSFVLEPEPINVRQSSSFVLDCKVAHKTGECSWSHNAQPVVVNGSPYQWSGTNEEGECSLMVKSADKVRDSGEWACNVSGVGNEQINSRSVVVNVRDTGNTEL